MTQREKILASWERVKEENINTVIAQLTYFGFVKESQTGSHISFTHPRLTEKYNKDAANLAEDYGPDGTLTIPVYQGHYAKSLYLKRALRAISIVTEERSEKDD